MLPQGFDPDYRPPAALDPLLAGLLAALHERHLDMLNLIAGLPGGGLDWRPLPAAPPLGGLALHILDVERYIAETAAGRPTPWWTGENGSRIEETVGEEPLRSLIVEVDRLAKEALLALAPATLRESAGDGQSIAALLTGDLDHVAMHHGQMQLTRHLWEAAHPRWRSSYRHWR